MYCKLSPKNPKNKAFQQPLMHNFLLLDQQSGLVWQVQYPRDSENIILISR